MLLALSTHRDSVCAGAPRDSADRPTRWQLLEL